MVDVVVHITLYIIHKYYAHCTFYIVHEHGKQHGMEVWERNKERKGEAEKSKYTHYTANTLLTSHHFIPYIIHCIHCTLYKIQPWHSIKRRTGYDMIRRITPNWTKLNWTPALTISCTKHTVVVAHQFSNIIRELWFY